MNAGTLSDLEARCLDRFTSFIECHGIPAEIIDCGNDSLTVAQAAAAVGCATDQVLKTLLFHDRENLFVIAIASGLGRVDSSKLIDATLLESARLARPQLVLAKLGYPAGGVPPLDLPAGVPVLVDTAAAALDQCYAGAGTTRHLVRLDPKVILRVNRARLESIAERS